jgi:hypothetical protein
MAADDADAGFRAHCFSLSVATIRIASGSVPDKLINLRASLKENPRMTANVFPAACRRMTKWRKTLRKWRDLAP